LVLLIGVTVRWRPRSVVVIKASVVLENEGGDLAAVAVVVVVMLVAAAAVVVALWCCCCCVVRLRALGRYSPAFRRNLRGAEVERILEAAALVATPAPDKPASETRTVMLDVMVMEGKHPG